MDRNLSRIPESESELENPREGDTQIEEYESLNNLTSRYNKPPRLTMKPVPNQPTISNISQVLAEDSNLSSEQEEETFDEFILNNVTPFTGAENVIEWLDYVESIFHQLKISRRKQFLAIPLLVVQEAKRLYLLNKDSIKSFDDFYTLLLLNYKSKDFHLAQTTPQLTPRPATITTNQDNSVNDIPVRKNVVFNETTKSFPTLIDFSESLPPRPILRSTALHDLEASSSTGAASEIRSTVLPSHNSIFSMNELDQTSYALRRAIVDSLIKNPKVFRGGKDDVKLWLEDVEQLFDTAQIPDSLKIDLIQYSLKGEALRWFKNNKSSFSSWHIFVKEVKETFLSPFYAEIAFKKLESYTQGFNQPIRSFYNEILKLCSEADPSMSDSSKLNYLLNKTKPSLQFEIRRKRPLTTKHFLEYAIEVEELFHLSNIDTSKGNAVEASYASTVSLPRSNESPSYSPNPPPTNPLVSFNSPCLPQIMNPNPNPIYPAATPLMTTNPNFPLHSNWYPSNPPQTSFHTQEPYLQNNQRRFQPQSGNPSRKTSYQSNYNHSSNPSKNNTGKPQLNSVSTPNINTVSNSTLHTTTPQFCSNCQQSGHTESACPHF